MTSPELENLARIGKLRRESPSDDEIEGLIRSGEERLTDAERTDLSYSSRFDLAYNAAHGLALAALRTTGYRSDNRYLVFQTLSHTVGMAAGKWRVLAKAHERRNLAEYEGRLERDERLLSELIATARDLLERIGASRAGPLRTLTLRAVVLRCGRTRSGSRRPMVQTRAGAWILTAREACGTSHALRRPLRNIRRAGDELIQCAPPGALSVCAIPR